MATGRKPTTVAEYVAALPPDRREAIETVRREVNRRLPEGFEEGFHLGMVGWCVPLSRFPAGYLGNPRMGLPFAALESGKSHMSLHLMSVYGDAGLRQRFEAAWKKTGKRLDMGKACIRFRRVEDLALDVVGDTIAATPVDVYVKGYEAARATAAKTRPAAKRKKPKA